ncbi:MAG: iron-containing alcohol dehydrogenase [Candidatus Firestonebacteria bacterium]
MLKFEMYWPVKFIFGPGEFKRTGAEAGLLGKKAFIVTGKNAVKKLGYLDNLTGQLKSSGIQFEIFDKAETNPRSSTIDEGGRRAKSLGCDFIIGLGGGSAMDAAKGIALIAKCEKNVSVWDFIHCSKKKYKINVKPLPMLMIPTLPATGSEGNPTAVITNLELKQKVHLMDNNLFPTISIIDPELTYSLTKEQTAYSGVDIVCHLLEPYLTNVKEAQLKDRMAEDIMLKALENTPKAMVNPQDPNYRGLMSYAGTIACSPFRQMAWNGKAYLHWMEHCLSAWTDVQHSEGLSCLLPAWMKYMKKYEFFAFRLNLFSEKVFGSKTASPGMETWLQQLSVKTKLTGITDELIEKMAGTVMEVYSGGKDHIELPSGDKMFREDFAHIYEIASGKKL